MKAADVIKICEYTQTFCIDGYQEDNDQHAMLINIEGSCLDYKGLTLRFDDNDELAEAELVHSSPINTDEEYDYDAFGNYNGFMSSLPSFILNDILNQLILANRPIRFGYVFGYDRGEKSFIPIIKIYESGKGFID